MRSSFPIPWYSKCSQICWSALNDHLLTGATAKRLPREMPPLDLMLIDTFGSRACAFEGVLLVHVACFAAEPGSHPCLGTWAPHLPQK